MQTLCRQIVGNIRINMQLMGPGSDSEPISASSPKGERGVDDEERLFGVTRRRETKFEHCMLSWLVSCGTASRY